MQMLTVYQAIIFLSTFIISSFNSTSNRQSVSPKEEVSTKATIRVKIGERDRTDSMTLLFYQDYVIKNVGYSAQTTLMDDDGYYNFLIDPIYKPGYISLAMGRAQQVHSNLFATIFKDYLIEPGDAISIQIDSIQPITLNDRVIGYYPYGLTSTGKGSEKIFLQLEWEKLSNSLCTSESIKNRNQSDLPLNIKTALYKLECADTIYKKKLDLLTKHRDALTKNAFEILHLDAIGERLYSHGIALFDERSISTDSQKLLVNRQRIDFSQQHLNINSSENYQISKSFCAGLFWLSVSKYRMSDYQEKAITLYEFIKTNYSKGLRDKLLTYYLRPRYGKLENNDWIFSDALATIQQPEYRSLLSEITDALTKGRTAYNFTLPDPTGRKISLSDFRGNVVVLDFWYTGCGYCASYYKNHLSKVEHLYMNNPNVKFVTISIDTDRTVWINSIRSNNYTSTDIINLYTAGQGGNHPVIDSYKVSGYPRPIIISKDGKIFNSNSKDLRRSGPLKKLIEDALNEKG